MKYLYTKEQKGSARPKTALKHNNGHLKKYETSFPKGRVKTP